MGKVKHSLLLNLSNQTNTILCKKTYLSQFSFIITLGLEYLNTIDKADSIPISFSIHKDGNLSINGVDGELINDRNIHVYTDKKITKSD